MQQDTFHFNFNLSTLTDITDVTHLVSSISMVDPLSRESPDILSGENTNIDGLGCLVVTVAVILAS